MTETTAVVEAPTALVPFDPTAPFNLDQHRAIGRAIRQTPWMIGAWYNQGIANGRTGAEMAEESDVGLATLRQAGSVVGKFGVLVDQYPPLPLGHFAAVMGQTLLRARQLLAFAAENGLSQAQLREHIREERPTPLREVPPQWPHIYEVIDRFNELVALVNAQWASANALERRTFIQDVGTFYAELQAME